MAKKNPHYSAKKLAAFQERLEDKRQEAIEELEYCKRELEKSLSEAAGESSTYSFHMADQGTDAQEREKTFMFAARQGKYIQTLEAAIERIENGTYGVCSKCGDQISEGRLRAVPTAKLCINCKSAGEEV